MKKPTVTVESRRIPPCTEWKHDTGMWCLFLVEHGRGVFQTAAFSHAIHLGDLGVLPTGTRGFFKAVPETEVSITSLHFVPESLSGPLSLGTRLILRQAASHWPGAMVFSRDTELTRRFKAFTQTDRIPKASGGGTSELMTLIAPVLEELKELLSRDRHPNEAAGDRILATLDAMNEGDAQEVPVTELARRCGCSRRHLSRLIRENCGCSLAAIRIELRLDKAARLLRNSENKIIDVAMDCGFNHLGSFTARFRRRFGATPGEWRKAQNGYGHHPQILPFPRLNLREQEGQRLRQR